MPPTVSLAGDDHGPACFTSPGIDAVIEEPCRQGDAAKVAAKVAALFELHSWRAANYDSRAHLRVALRAAHLGAGHVTDVARAAPATFAPCSVACARRRTSMPRGAL